MAASGSPRARRADAERNRAAILDAAREVFEAEGALAPMDAIAVRAGVGNATLYRNFPTRDALLAAVMASSVASAVDRAAELSATQPPREALVSWLADLAWRLRVWHDLPYCLANPAESTEAGESAVAVTTDPLVAETGRLLEAAQAAGAATAGVRAEEVYELVLATSWAIDRYADDEAAARRRVELATAGVFSSRG